MALRTIVLEGDPVLRKKCRPVTEFNSRIAQLLDDMRETLKAANGLGLAAPQVGVLRRAVLIMDGEDIVELLNPEIIEKEGEEILQEACLSCPGLSGYVLRPQRIKVRANARDGSVFEREFTDMGARAVCHETDHLDGVLFLDIAEELTVESEDDEPEME